MFRFFLFWLINPSLSLSLYNKNRLRLISKNRLIFFSCCCFLSKSNEKSKIDLFVLCIGLVWFCFSGCCCQVIVNFCFGFLDLMIPSNHRLWMMMIIINVYHYYADDDYYCFRSFILLLNEWIIFKYISFLPILFRVFLSFLIVSFNNFHHL